MASYNAELTWEREGQDFLSNRYSRRHLIRFDGGVELPGSSSPHVVPLPWSDASAVDPEEAFVAALASCHMLWFLSIAAQRGFCVDRYEDAAEGVREGEMPPIYYTPLHSTARLSDQEKQALIAGLEATIGGSQGTETGD